MAAEGDQLEAVADNADSVDSQAMSTSLDADSAAMDAEFSADSTETTVKLYKDLLEAKQNGELGLGSGGGGSPGYME